MELTIIQQKIYEVRGLRIMLDKDLAEIYEVETRTLKQAVNRNKDRFPKDFMFQLTNKEVDQLVSQNLFAKPQHTTTLPFSLASCAELVHASASLKPALAVLVSK